MQLTQLIKLPLHINIENYIYKPKNFKGKKIIFISQKILKEIGNKLCLFMK